MRELLRPNHEVRAGPTFRKPDFTTVGRFPVCELGEASRGSGKLDQRGILVRSAMRDSILKELPEAYKNLDEVIEIRAKGWIRIGKSRGPGDGVIKG